MSKFKLADSFLKAVTFILASILNKLLLILFWLMPVGLHMFMLQNMDKPTPVSGISAHLTNNSTWKYAAPGIIIIARDGREYIKNYNKLMHNISINTNKIILCSVVLITILVICIFMHIVL